MRQGMRNADADAEQRVVIEDVGFKPQLVCALSGAVGVPRAIANRP